MSREFRVLSPTAILGYGFPEASFKRGMERKPHLIGVDAGSTDPGPYYLGAGKSFTNRAFVKRDLTYMITAGVAEGIPVVIGSAGGSGAKPHLDWCHEIIREIAKENGLTFRLAVIPADIEKKMVLEALSQGRVKPLSFVPEATAKDVEESVHIVAQMGCEPIVKALEMGAQVVLAGRCYDPACFAAVPIRQGFDKGLAMHMGKILECGAIAATPGSGADCVLGTLTEDSFILEPLSDKRVFTPMSAAAHTLYEKSDPYHLPGPGGAIDLTATSFTELSGGRVEVKGSRYEKTKSYFLKLEGVRNIGYRTVSIAGTRDPIMISKIDEILPQVEAQVRSMMKNPSPSDRLMFHVYGKNGVMGAMEPLASAVSHELCIIIEALCATQEAADTLCSVTRSTLLHYGYEGRIATAGNLAFPFSPSDVPMGAAYTFSLYHLIEVADPCMFPIYIESYTNGEVRK